MAIILNGTTGITTPDIDSTAAPDFNGTNITNIPAAQLTGALPAISGASLTGIPSPVLASQSEAEAGTDSTKFMSPARVTQQITAALKTVGGTSLIGSGDIPVADAAADYGTTVYTSTGSFTASTDMTIIVQAVGAGGSGAVASHTSPTYEGANYSGTNDHAQGGASGAYSSKLLVLQTGDTINFTIGSGGGRESVNTAGTAQGNAGGATTVTGSNLGASNVNLSMTCGGGAGGAGSISTNTPTIAAAATASGGDTNRDGTPSHNTESGGVGGATPPIDAFGGTYAVSMSGGNLHVAIDGFNSPVQTLAARGLILDAATKPGGGQGIKGRTINSNGQITLQASRGTLGSGGASSYRYRVYGTGYFFSGIGGDGFVAISQKRSV